MLSCPVLQTLHCSLASFPPGFELAPSVHPYPAPPQSGFFQALFCNVYSGAKSARLMPFASLLCWWLFLGVCSPPRCHCLSSEPLTDIVLIAFVPCSKNPALGLPGSARVLSRFLLLSDMWLCAPRGVCFLGWPLR